jgi:predicted transcriptional regulator
VDELRTAGSSGLARTAISDLFGRNRSSARIGRMLAQLQALGLVHAEQDSGTRGRPRERWVYSQMQGT